ncbi:MAG: hypothetical protein R2911_28080 [Caldilineaceae bacterium]
MRPLASASYLRIEPKTGLIEVGHINYAPRLQQTRRHRDHVSYDALCF